MSAATVDCAACGVAQPPPTGSEEMACARCGRPLHVLVFPALWRPIAAGLPATLAVSPEEATCYNHPASVAVIPCALCGRFLCALCDIEFDERHLCPACFPTARPSGGSATLESERVLWDSIALSTALMSCILWWASLITSFVVLFLVVRKWRTPLSLVPRSRIRFIAAAGIAVLQLMVWGLVLTVGLVSLRRL